MEQTTDALAAVRRVVTSGGGLVWIVTPGGEFGGGRRSLYQLTFGEARPQKLLVELDEQLLFIVTLPNIVDASEEAVRLSFAQLTFDWQEYGTMHPRVSTWTTGHLDRVAQGGTPEGWPLARA